MKTNEFPAKAVDPGKTRYLLLHGVLGWGLLTASLFSIWTGCSPKPATTSGKPMAAEPANSASTAALPSTIDPARNEESGGREAFVIPPKARSLIQRGFVSPNNLDTGETIAAMYLILDKWNPVGRKVEDVESFMGKPSRTENNRLIYAFDTGSHHYEWLLHVEEGIVSHVSESHTLE